MGDLFDFADDERRADLRRAGWYECVGFSGGRLHWRSPDGRILTEPEAFRELENARESRGCDAGEVSPITPTPGSPDAGESS